MKPEISQIIYDVVHKCHDEWRDKHGYRFNNQIIDLLRNRLWKDAQEFYEVNITKRLLEVPEQYRCPRNFLADLSFRRFKEGFVSKPCEICNFERAPNVAHIIPRAFGGPDDDWNLVHLCANHHYLFDRGLLTKDEYYAIRWDEKGSEASYFAEHVRARQHQPYWKSSSKEANRYTT